MTPIVFEIHGRAQTAGSKKAFPFQRKDGSLGATVVDDNPKGREWKKQVGWAAAAARGPIGLLEGPLSVEFVFELLRPSSHFGKNGVLPSAPQYPVTRPDLLKRARAVEDALIGVLYRDDSQIVRELLVKKFGDCDRLTVRVERPWGAEERPAAAEPLSLFSEGAR
jgi:Holliday junction resolvase RusA-like endonuclease